MSQTGNITVALLTGAAIGASLGILFAPDKGSETRKNIKVRFNKSKDQIADKYHDVVDFVKNKVGSKANLEDTLEELISDGSRKAEDVISLLEKKLDGLKAKSSKPQSQKSTV